VVETTNLQFSRCYNFVSFRDEVDIIMPFIRQHRVLLFAEVNKNDLE